MTDKSSPKTDAMRLMRQQNAEQARELVAKAAAEARRVKKSKPA